jgi:hypothetical protein
MRSTSELQATLRPPGKLSQPIILGLLGESMIKTTKPSGAGMVKITFSLPADEPAGAVSVVGDFNNWDPSAHPLRARSNRTRSASVTVPAGSTLRFRYLAEGGMWFDDETVPAGGGGDPVLAVLAEPPLTSNLAHDAGVLPHGLGAVGAGLPAEPAVHGDAEVADVARRGGDPPP